jgi:hypothetical protein
MKLFIGLIVAIQATPRSSNICTWECDKAHEEALDACLPLYDSTNTDASTSAAQMLTLSRKSAQILAKTATRTATLNTTLTNSSVTNFIITTTMRTSSASKIPTTSTMTATAPVTVLIPASTDTSKNWIDVK